MKHQWIVIFAIIVVSLSFGAIPAAANHIDNAKVTDDCAGYQITLSASQLRIGVKYTIAWEIDGLPKVIKDHITFVAHHRTFQRIVLRTWSHYGITLAGDYTLSGTATLEGYNQVPIAFSQSNLSCPQCLIPSANSSNFNGTEIPGGDYVWFNANFTAKGIPSTGATVFLQSSTIQFTANNNQYKLLVPNAQITFSPSASCSSTTFDSSTNTWMTVVPVKGDDEVFLSGLAYPVPSEGLPGGINPVTWQGSFGSDTSGVSVQWKWGAAIYSTFSTNYNTLAVKPGHQTSCSYNNGDHAGTPEGTDPNSGQPFKNFVVGGARGGGGSDWTGSWSGTNGVNLQCQ